MSDRGRRPWKLPAGLKGKIMRKDKLLILFLTGLLLLVIAIPGENKKPADEEENSFSGAGTEGGMTEEEYVSRMEARLEKLLSQMEGAGEVSVMITLQSSVEKVVEKDTESGDETVTESDSQGGSRTTKNQTRREETVYDTKAGSQQSPYVSMELSPKVEGVVVIAGGGDDAVVVKNITEAVQALFGIDTHKIRIVKGRRVEQ